MGTVTVGVAGFSCEGGTASAEGALTVGAGKLGRRGGGFFRSSSRRVRALGDLTGWIGYGAGVGIGTELGGAGCVSLAGSRGAGRRRTAGSCLTCCTSELAMVGMANPATAPQKTRLDSERQPRWERLRSISSYGVDG